MRLIYLLMIALMIPLATAKVYDVTWSISGSKVNITYDGMLIEFMNMSSVPTLNKEYFIMNKTHKIIGVNSSAININTYFKPVGGVLANITFGDCINGQSYNLYKSDLFLDVPFTGQIMATAVCVNNKITYSITNFSSYILTVNAQAPSTKSVEACYSFDSVSTDSSGNSRNLIQIGTVPYSTTIKKLGSASAGAFSDSNFFNLTYGTWTHNMRALSGGSVSFWINITSISAWQGVYSNRHDSSTPNGMIQTGFRDDTDKIWADHYTTGWNSLNGQTISTLNQWHHIVYVFHTNGTVIQYYNGAAVAYVDIGSISTLTNWFTIGRAQNIGPMVGKIDEFAVFNVSLTPANVTTLYNSGNGKTCAETVTLFTTEAAIVQSNISLEQWTTVNTTRTATRTTYNISLIVFSNFTLTNTNVSVFMNNTYLGSSSNGISANNFTKFGIFTYSILNNEGSSNMKIETWINSSQLNNSDVIFVPFASNTTGGTSTSSCVQNLGNAYFRPNSCAVFP